MKNDRRELFAIAAKLAALYTIRGSALTLAFATVGCGSDTLITSPSSSPPTTPPGGTTTVQEHPVEVTFQHDGKTSKATRIGQTRYSGLTGSHPLPDVMESAKISIQINNQGLMTKFDGVTPSGSRGLVALVRMERFTDKIREVQISDRQAYAVYEWQGFSVQSNVVYSKMGA
jgi:hypothetical protein